MKFNSKLINSTLTEQPQIKPLVSEEEKHYERVRCVLITFVMLFGLSIIIRVIL